MHAYETDTREIGGQSFMVEWFADEHMGPPWEEHDGHGPVSDWTTRDKRPGELVLNGDRHGWRRFYDFAEAVRIARRDGWNCAPYTHASKGAQAAAAARADFEYLRRWCDDQWHWCGIRVTLLDEEGIPSGISSDLWGLESEPSDYHDTVIDELASECLRQMQAHQYPVTHEGV